MSPDTIPGVASARPNAPGKGKALVTEQAAEPLPTDSTIFAFLVVLFCFTPSNPAFLCCLAGVLGALGRRVVLTNQRDRLRDHAFPFLSAILRSFLVYLTVISGLLVLLENPILGTASPGQYIRFAGLLSLIGFFVNCDATVFATLLDRVRNRAQENVEEDETEGTEEDEKTE
ncbi:MAG: hypothetical protein BRD55_10550 [Bacteroidetes bacterium SW_9_63_38]|nr:MAG: hypothetical protein BRD55_10550 [Bacteroidetes bacterium SW_9_63_38]